MCFRILCFWLFLAFPDFHKVASAFPAAPLLPVSLTTAEGSRGNPDVVAMLIDLDKIETELKNPEMKTRTYDLDAGNTEIEKETKRLLTDVAAERALPLPVDKSQLENNILAISLLRNRDQKKMAPRWNFDDEDEIAEESNDEISKIVQIILHKGNGVSVTIQDGKSKNHGH